MYRHNITNVIYALSEQQNEVVTKLYSAQTNACHPECDPVEAVETIIRFHRLADSINRLFDTEIQQLTQVLEGR